MALDRSTMCTNTVCYDVSNCLNLGLSFCSKPYNLYPETSIPRLLCNPKFHTYTYRNPKDLYWYSDSQNLTAELYTR